jgi:hypothetical protein
MCKLRTTESFEDLCRQRHGDTTGRVTKFSVADCGVTRTRCTPTLNTEAAGCFQLNLSTHLSYKTFTAAKNSNLPLSCNLMRIYPAIRACNKDIRNVSLDGVRSSGA